MKIRQMKIDDYEYVSGLWRQSGLEHRPNGRDSRDAIRRQIEAHGELLLVAEDDGDIIGVVIGSHDHRKGYVNRLTTSPGSRRQGVAKALLSRLEDEFHKIGIFVIAANIYEENSASAALAEHLGFKSFEKVKYYSKRLRDDS